MTALKKKVKQKTLALEKKELVLCEKDALRR